MPPYRILTQKFAFKVASAIAVQMATSAAWAQSSCSSDGQRTPTALIERFIGADCETCWSDAKTVKPKAGELALDWIMPSVRGDEAPLSAAATRDSLYRLEALNQPTTKRNFNLRRAVLPNPLPLRVARGVALGGYIGASIELKPARGKALPVQTMTAQLLLVEEIPAGTDGTPVARNLVRNSLQLTWNQTNASPQQANPSKRLYDSRPMSIPAGANPDRLRVVGWVEDSVGRVIGSAASQCLK